jgi:hypothetical protein
MNDAANDLVRKLTSLNEIFKASSIVMDKSTNVKDSSQIEVLIYAGNSNIGVNEDLLNLIPMPGTSSREDSLCEIDD